VSVDEEVCNLITADCEWIEADFINPRNDAKVQTWYHWINGHLSKEEITKDLEDMKDVGIGGFILFNAAEGMQGTPPGNAPYYSDEFWDIFIHTKKEAKRIGLEMGIMNAPGWATSGGPWNTPEHGMQEVVWTEEKVSGPSRFSGKLSIPEPVLGLERDMKRDTVFNKRYYMPREALKGYYNDIVLLAFPTPEGELSGNPYRIEKWWNKAGYARLKDYFSKDSRTAPAGEVVNLDKIIDISNKLDNEGILNWDVPEGNWTILRVGYQPTGRSNHPAPVGGKGLEVDKLSAKAVDIHFQEAVMKLVNAGGEDLRDVISTVILDSYEAGHQNWTKGFEDEFKQSCSYDIKYFLPAITGRIVGSISETENFLWDFRKVLSDMMDENYYKRFQTLAHQNGLSFGAEHYGNYGNFDDFNAGAYVDVSSSEFWAKTNRRAGEAKLASSTAHTYGRKLVAAEAFTGRIADIFETNPRDIKAQGDWFFTKGINHFWLHGYTHDPYQKRPGIGLGGYGVHFRRQNTWWKYSHGWFEYMNRAQYMLQQGYPHMDILVYVGEDATVAPKPVEQIYPQIPFGYDYDFCNRDILEKAKVRGGKIVLPQGQEYSILVVMDNEYCRPAVLETLSVLVKSGAILVGAKPAGIPTLADHEHAKNTFNEQTRLLWGKADGKTITKNKYGKGLVYWGKPVGEVFKTLDIMPDFEFTLKSDGNYGETLFPGNGIEFIHRQTAATDVYFVSNQHNKSKTIEAIFRIANKTPELWNPETGEIIVAPEYRKLSDGRMAVTLDFDETGSVFVVFRQTFHKEPVTRKAGKKKENQLTFNTPWQVSFEGNEAPGNIEMAALYDISQHDNADVKYFSGTIIYKNRIDISKVELEDALGITLKLGQVEVAAEVFVNNRSAGVLWKYPYQIDIIDYLKAGENTVRVEVANLWVNRVIGDWELPDDSEWVPNTGIGSGASSGFGLARIPGWVLRGEDSPTGRGAFVGYKWEHLENKKPLPSGLIGPVSINIKK